MKLHPSGVLGFPEDVLWESPEAPCFVDEQGIIYNGGFQDVLETLESNTIDLIVTDPPYGINYRGCNFSRSCHGNNWKYFKVKSRNFVQLAITAISPGIKPATFIRDTGPIIGLPNMPDFKLD